MAVNADERFQLGVGPWTGTRPTIELTEFDTVSLTFNADGGADCSFGVRGNSAVARAIDEYATDVWVYLDGAVLARLRIVNAPQEWGESGEDIVTVTAVDYKRLLNSRHFWSAQSYSAVGQADLIWQVIQHTQAQTNGDLGITAGTLNNGGQNRDRSWIAGENIGKELTDLSGVINGPFWTIDGNLALNVTLYDVFPVRDTPIMLGATAERLRRESSGLFANAAFVDGDGDETVPVLAEAATLAADTRGRWETAQGFPNVVLQQTLQDKADGILTDGQTPVAAWTATIKPSRYLSDANFSVGEFVEIVVPATTAAPVGSPGFSVGGQVMNVALTLDANGLVTCLMQLIEVPT